MQNWIRSAAESIWRSPALLTVLGTMFCLILLLGLHLLFDAPPAQMDPGELALSVFFPLLLIAPLLFVLGKQARTLSALRHDYENAIGRDSLTSCLNSTLFSALVDAHPTLTGSRSGRRRGSFLVVDVDQLAALNRDAGRRIGDHALRAIGEIIQASVRSDDIVGRLGGGRFGIFLPGATSENAGKIAERIRRAVSEASFRPGGTERPLSVSVGAVLFEQEVDYDNLVYAAEQALAQAKAKGRNRVEYGRANPGSSSSRPSLH